MSPMRFLCPLATHTQFQMTALVLLSSYLLLYPAWRTHIRVTKVEFTRVIYCCFSSGYS